MYDNAKRKHVLYLLYKLIGTFFCVVFIDTDGNSQKICSLVSNRNRLLYQLLNTNSKQVFSLTD